MRRLVAIAMLSVVLAAPAAAQEGRIAASQSEASAVALRGAIGDAPSEGEAPGSGGALAGLIPMPPPVPPVGTPVVADGRQCKRTCNRDYYFCLAAGEETCASTWTRCTARCG